jgi:6-phosphofructokinase 1
VIEVMGRATGWIAAGSVLAKPASNDAPHIILLPEIPFAEESFLERVQSTVDALKYCVVVVGEGLRTKDGLDMAADKSRVDAFGHPVLSGAADHLARLVTDRLQLKSRSVKLGYAQRAAAHFASAADSTAAATCGAAAVRAAMDNQGGMMVKIVRTSNAPYRWTTGLQPLGEIANVEHFVPRDWISEDGFMPNEKFIEYARPLIEGEVKVPMEGGLPKYVTLDKSPVEKKLPARPE